MDKIVKDRANAKVKGDDFYQKFKETGKTKFKRKAKQQYEIVEGLNKKLENPQPITKTVSVTTTVNSNNKTNKVNSYFSGNKGNKAYSYKQK